MSQPCRECGLNPASHAGDGLCSACHTRAMNRMVLRYFSGSVVLAIAIGVMVGRWTGFVEAGYIAGLVAFGVIYVGGAILRFDILPRLMKRDG